MFRKYLTTHFAISPARVSKFKSAFVALAIISMPSAAYGVSSNQFDLLCSIDSHWRDGSGAELIGQSGSYALHVDLLHNMWCDGDCGSAQKIANAGIHKVTFAHSENDDFTVDRDTGHLYRHQGIKGGTAADHVTGDTSGTCHVKPYWTQDVRPLE